MGLIKKIRAAAESMGQGSMGQAAARERGRQAKQRVKTRKAEFQRLASQPVDPRWDAQSPKVGPQFSNIGTEVK